MSPPTRSMYHILLVFIGPQCNLWFFNHPDISAGAGLCLYHFRASNHGSSNNKSINTLKGGEIQSNRAVQLFNRALYMKHSGAPEAGCVMLDSGQDNDRL